MNFTQTIQYAGLTLLVQGEYTSTVGEPITATYACCHIDSVMDINTRQELIAELDAEELHSVKHLFAEQCKIEVMAARADHQRDVQQEECHLITQQRQRGY